MRLDFDVDETPSSLAAMLSRLLGAGDMTDQDVTVDATNSGYLGPLAAVTLFGMRRLARTKGKSVFLVPPRKPALLAYCSYSGLLQEFECGAAPTDPPTNNTTPTVQFSAIDLTAMTRVVRLVRKHFKLSLDAESSLRLGMVELMHNVIDHARSLSVAFSQRAPMKASMRCDSRWRIWASASAKRWPTRHQPIPTSMQ